MRIKLTLVPVDQNSIIPINYQYPLSAAIYNILATASLQYAAFLHDQGYLSPNGKPIKLFTFSKLWCPQISRYKSNLLRVKGLSPCTVFIASPMLSDFIQHFVMGLFEQQEIVIRALHYVARFTVQLVETIAPPLFKANTKFTCSSPIVVNTKQDNRNSEYYYRPEDLSLSDAIRENLKQKYETIYKKDASQFVVKFTPDINYINKRKSQNKRVTKLIKIKEGDTRQETDIICFEVPFSLEGSTALMEVAWECGIGMKNSLGFGMVDVIDNV